MFHHLAKSAILIPFLTFFIFPKLVFSQANFSASITSGCVPQIINFTSSAPGAVSYNWNLGNGNFSNLQNPGITYTTAGVYTIVLTVGYADGTTETVTKSGYINIFGNPNSEFTANVFNICQGETVQFSDLSTPGSNPITGWLWDFGDGDTSVLANPSHTYTIPGSFPITLITSDVNGCSNIELKPAYILVNPTPQADFTVDNALGCNTPFSPNFTSFPNSGGITHSWTFGNATTSSQANPSTTYTNPGSYTVTHIVTDTLGCADTVTKVNLISVGTGALNIQASDYLVCPFQTITFACNGPFGALVNWNFGVPGATSNICNPTYSYNTPGTYVVTATLTDGNGCTFTGSTIITVSTPPVVDFTVSDTLLCDPPWQVSFTNNTSGAVNYLWQFGNGSTSSAPSPTFTYPTLPISSATGQPYYYDVILTATNSDGCISTVVKPNHIVTGQTEAGAIAFPKEGCAPIDVQFTSISVTPSTFTSFTWDFGNGQVGTGPNPLITYPDTGYFDVSLIVTTLHGCTDTVLFNDFIKAGEVPTADFEVDTTYGCASFVFEFTNLSQDADSAYWIFSDGGSSSTWDPFYQFQDTGWMSVTLIAYDRGCPDTLTKTDYIYIDPPIARFTPNNLIICDIPATITFEDTSIGAQTWLWDFGDNSPTSSQTDPVHTYTTQGTFIVQLIVGNNTTGCADTMSSSVSIQTVEADFAPDTTFGCLPMSISFSDSSTNPSSWFWNFGLSSSPFQNPQILFNQTGYYDVSLFVVNSLGCTDDTTYTDLIKIFKPDVDFTVPDQTGCAPFTVPFINGTTSLAPITNWDWAFGVPGGVSALENPTFTYPNPGLYSITLTATDSIGCVDTKTRPAYVYVTEPMADFSVAHPINCVNNPIFFTDLSSGVALAYSWDFGDNTTDNVMNPVHSYNANGVYNAVLTITDINGCTSQDSMTIVIETPQIDFVADTTTADCPPLLVNFTASVLSSHTFNSWVWDFGDMTTSVVQNPSHLYVIPGDYTVIVTATTAAGCSAVDSVSDMIQLGGPYGSFSFSPMQVCPNDPVTFTATGTSNIAQYLWDLGGGNLDTGQTVIFGYPFSGVYNPVLIVEDSSGCQVLIQDPNSVTVYPLPVADFNFSAPVLCGMGTVNFSDLTSSADPISTWEWNFGDGSLPGSGANPAHTYNSPGTYDVQLIVTTVNGCSDTIVKPGLITVFESPTAVIGVSDSMGCEPFTVQFSDLSPSTNFTIQNWDWNFGIFGANSTQQNPDYTYADDGTYQAFLLLTDINGCTGSASQEITVWPLPEPDFGR